MSKTQSRVAGIAAALLIVPMLLWQALVATAAPTPQATAAAKYLAGQLVGGEYLKSATTGQPDVGSTADAVLGLIASGTQQDAAARANAWLQSKAPSLTDAATLARLTIVAAALGDDPASYGGANLTGKLTAALDAKKSDLANPYAQGLAIIALKRAGQQPSEAVVNALVSRQAANGQFYFGKPGGSDYFEDPDTTGIAIAALQGIAGDKASAALTKAATWATGAEQSGYWKSFSPANTTGLIASALQDAGTDVSASVTWLEGQQAKAGGTGLPASLNGTKPDAYATAQGLLLLGGHSLATVSSSAGTASESPSPAAASPSTVPVGTSAVDPNAAGPVAIVAVIAGLVVVGALVVVSRSTRS